MTGWERIALERTGGFAGTTVTVQVGSDEPGAERWTGLLEGVDLGAWDDVADDPGGADRFTYDLQVWAADGVHGLRCGERSLPEQVRPLVQELLRSRATPGR